MRCSDSRRGDSGIAFRLTKVSWSQFPLIHASAASAGAEGRLNIHCASSEPAGNAGRRRACCMVRHPQEVPPCRLLLLSSHALACQPVCLVCVPPSDSRPRPLLRLCRRFTWSRQQCRRCAPALPLDLRPGGGRGLRARPAYETSAIAPWRYAFSASTA